MFDFHCFMRFLITKELKGTILSLKWAKFVVGRVVYKPMAIMGIRTDRDNRSGTSKGQATHIRVCAPVSVYLCPLVEGNHSLA